MRPLLLVMAASLAGACVIEEPSEIAGVSWSESEGVSWSQVESEVDVRPIVWRPSCHHHFECCQETKLGKKNDAPNKSRCHFCADLCDHQGQWPERTGAGDCKYWLKQYEIRPPRPECR